MPQDGSIKIIYDLTDNNSSHLTFKNNGTININGGTLQSFRIVENDDNAVFNINGGNIYSYYFNRVGRYSEVRLYYSVLHYYDTGTINITGGNFDTLNIDEGGNDYFYTIDNNGTVNVTGGTFNKKSYLLLNYGTAIFDGVTDLGCSSINNKLETSILKFKDTELVAGTATMSISNEGSIEFDGVTKPDGTTGVNVSAKTLSIENSNINNITINGKSEALIDNSTFTKATITSSTDTTISNSTMTQSYVSVYSNEKLNVLNSTIKNNNGIAINNRGTLTLGAKDGNMSDIEILDILPISRNSFYKYKREMQLEV